MSALRRRVIRKHDRPDTSTRAAGADRRDASPATPTGGERRRPSILPSWHGALAWLSAAGPLVFVSYRRADSGGHARLLVEDLKRRYGSGRIYFDVDSVEAGSAPWREQLAGQIARCQATVAVVGPGWQKEIADRDERRADDPVRYELGRVREVGRPVIGVRVGGADPPSGLPDDLAWLEEQHFIEVVPGQEAGGNRQVRAALDRLLPLRSRRWVRLFAVWAAGVVAAAVIAFVALRATQPCRFERCLPEYDVADSVVLMGAGVGRDADGSETSDDVADRFTEELAARLGEELGQGTILYRLDTGQLDVARESGPSIVAVTDVLARSRADLLITNAIRRPEQLNGISNRTEYLSDVYLGYVRDAEDLRGRRLEFAAVEAEFPNDIERSGSAELVQEAMQELVPVVGLLDAMHQYEVRQLDDALDGFDRLLDTDRLTTRDAAVIHQLRANVFLELGELDDAADAYERARSLDPSFDRASLGLAEVELLRALALGCERSGTVLAALDAADEGYSEVSVRAKEVGDVPLQIKALVGSGRTSACRSLIHAGSSAKNELDIGDTAKRLFADARALVDATNADIVRETLSAAGISEARLALRRAALAGSLDDGPAREQELDRAEALLGAEGGVLARTNRVWVTAEAHELLAQVHAERGEANASEEELAEACDDHRSVIENDPGEPLVEQSEAALERLGCDAGDDG